MVVGLRVEVWGLDFHFGLGVSALALKYETEMHHFDFNRTVVPDRGGCLSTSHNQYRHVQERLFPFC